MECAIIDGPQTEAFEQLGGEVRAVPEISGNAEISEIIDAMSARHYKQIPADVKQAICSVKTDGGEAAAQNPLYLSLIVQYLVMMDRSEHAIIESYKKENMRAEAAISRFMTECVKAIPGSPEDAYLAILKRLENVIGADFVSSVLGLIAITRSGLREEDIEGALTKLGMGFSSADFSWLRMSLHDHFSQGDALQWDFSHQSLRRALRKTRMPELIRLNESLVDYMLEHLEDSFLSREIMNQLYVADRPDIAAGIIRRDRKLTDREIYAKGLADIYVELYFGMSRDDIKAAAEREDDFLHKVTWLDDRANADLHYRIGELYTITLVGILPDNTPAEYKVSLISSVLKNLDGNSDAIGAGYVISTCQNILGDLYTDIGVIAKAGEFYRKSLDASERIYDQTGTTAALRDLSVSYNKMGDHLTALGETERAGEFCRKLLDAAERIYEQTGTTAALRDLSISYNNMGDHLTVLGETDSAGEFYKKSLEFGIAHV
jgi:tetratricopeptide (TPR) repeat protein